VVYGFSKLPLLDHRSHKNGCDLVAAGVVVFIPGYDQQAVVGLRKLNVAINVLLQPCIALGNGAVMHIVIEIGIDDRHGGQVCKVRWEAGERLVRCGRHIGEVYPRSVFFRVSARGANRGTGGRQIFGESGEGLACGSQLSGQVFCGEAMRAGVIRNALVRPREQIKVIGLAGMLNRKGLSKQRALLGKTVDIRRRRRTDDGSERMVLFNHDHHMVRRRNAKQVGLRHRQ